MRDRPIQRYNEVCHSEKRILRVIIETTMNKRGDFPLLIFIVLGMAWLDPLLHICDAGTNNF